MTTNVCGKRRAQALGVVLGALVVLVGSWLLGIRLSFLYVSDPTADSGTEELGEALLCLVFPPVMSALWLYSFRGLLIRRRADASVRAGR
jgi:hypothetical protein